MEFYLRPSLVCCERLPRLTRSFYEQCDATRPVDPPPASTSDLPLQDQPASEQEWTYGYFGNGTSTMNLARWTYDTCPIGTPDPQDGYGAHEPMLNDAYLGGRDVQFYNLGNGVGLVYPATFQVEPVNGASHCFSRYVVDAFLGVQNFSNAGITKILIDTSGNSGGRINLARILELVILGPEYLDYNSFNAFFRKSPVGEAIMQATNTNQIKNFTLINPSEHRSGFNVQSLGFTDIFSPGVNRTANGVTFETSNIISDALDIFKPLDRQFNFSTLPRFNPANIEFIGSGLCGSACGLFTNFLVEFGNVTGYMHTPIVNGSIGMAAVTTLSAVDSAGVYAEMQSTGAAVSYPDLVPKPLVKGMMGFTIKSPLSLYLAPDVPLAYRPVLAKRTYQMTEEFYNDPMAEWRYVASQVFG